MSPWYCFTIHMRSVGFVPSRSARTSLRLRRLIAALPSLTFEPPFLALRLCLPIRLRFAQGRLSRRFAFWLSSTDVAVHPVLPLWRQQSTIISSGGLRSPINRLSLLSRYMFYGLMYYRSGCNRLRRLTKFGYFLRRFKPEKNPRKRLLMRSFRTFFPAKHV